MRLEIPSTFTVIAFCLLLTACTSSLKPFKNIIPPSRDVALHFSNENKNEIKVLYVTCGMLIFEIGDKAFFFDPYFSYQRFSQIPFSIKTRKRFYNSFKQRVESTVDKNKVTTGFISHTHFDHLMDLPVLIDDHYFPNLKTVYGSDFMPRMIYHHANKGVQLEAIQQNQVFNPLAKTDSEFQWLPVSDSIQVLPIASMHAPHQYGMLVMNSNLDEKYFRKEKFKNPYVRSKGFKWDAGCNYSFLIRIKKSDGSFFKIFIQTSGSHTPYGLPPAGEKADLAILCFASTQEVKDYPNYLMRATEAKKLILIHWEDFFRYPKNEDDVRIVPGTRKRVVKKRLDQLKLESNPEVIMPKPGTRIKISY